MATNPDDEQARVGARDLAQAIGANARTARQSLGLTQADIAETIDLATVVYGRLERGLMLPSVPTLVRLAGALKVTPNELLAESPTAAEAEPQPRPTSSAMKLIVRRLDGASPAQLERARVVLAALLGKRRKPRKK